MWKIWITQLSDDFWFLISLIYTSLSDAVSPQSDWNEIDDSDDWLIENDWDEISVDECEHWQNEYSGDDSDFDLFA